MKCPGCKTRTERLILIMHKGKVLKFCPRCPGISFPKFRSHQSRKYDKWELPKEEIKRTQSLRPTRRHPDSPILRDFANATPARPRCTTYDFGDTSRSVANVRALTKAQMKLGPQVKLLYSDGFKRVWEQEGG